jgi:hypothetical protein
MVNPSWETFQSPNKNQKIPISNIPKDEEKPEDQKPSWGNFQDPMSFQGEIDPTEEESTFGYLARNTIALGSRVGEQILGRIGNVEKFSKDIMTNYPAVTGGIVGWALSKLLGKEKYDRMVKGPPGQEQMFPTSEHIKEASQKLSGGYTAPKTKGEKRFQEKVEDIASTITGKTIAAPSARNIALNNILTPVAANVSKDIVQDLGFGDDKANLAKLAVWLPLSLAFNVNSPKYASELTNRGRQGFDQKLQVNVPRYESELNKVSKNMLQGDPRSALAQQQIAGIRNDMSSGQTAIGNILNRYDAINAAKRDRGLFALNVQDKKAAIRNINEVLGVVRKEIQHLGKNSPKALMDWEDGIQAWATIHKSKAISNVVESWANGPYAKMLAGPALGLFGVGSAAAYSAPAYTGPISIGAAGLYKTGQTIARMWNDPNLNRYYWNSISAAQKENLPAFLSNYVKLNDKLEKSSMKPESKYKK